MSDRRESAMTREIFVPVVSGIISSLIIGIGGVWWASGNVNAAQEVRLTNIEKELIEFNQIIKVVVENQIMLSRVDERIENLAQDNRRLGLSISDVRRQVKEIEVEVKRRHE